MLLPDALLATSGKELDKLSFIATWKATFNNHFFFFFKLIFLCIDLSIIEIFGLLLNIKATV